MSEEITNQNPAVDQSVADEVPAAAPAASPESAPVSDAAKCEEYLAGWKRAIADYANLKKEMETVYGRASREGQIVVVTQLLPLLEGMLKALAQAPRIEVGMPPNVEEVRRWIQGIDQLKQQLEAVFNRSGVTLINEDNVQFDPNIHEAMMTEKRDGVQTGRVLKILEAGYRLGEQTLRPARVVVAE